MTTDYRIEYPPPDDWSTYETLIAPDGTQIATLTEPEDRTWGRDLRAAVDHMRDLARRLASAEERARRAEQRVEKVHDVADHLGRLADLKKRGVPTIREAYAHAQELVLAAITQETP